MQHGPARTDPLQGDCDILEFDGVGVDLLDRSSELNSPVAYQCKVILSWLDDSWVVP